MASLTRRIRKSVHSPEQLALRELLIAARDKAGLTQQKLARRLGKPQSFIAKYGAVNAGSTLQLIRIG